MYSVLVQEFHRQLEMEGNGNRARFVPGVLLRFEADGKGLNRKMEGLEHRWLRTIVSSCERSVDSRRLMPLFFRVFQPSRIETDSVLSRSWTW
jgi:hypothetical protein